MKPGKSFGTGLDPSLLAAVVIIVLGTWLRFSGLDFGLPFLYDPDEPDFVNRAMKMVVSGNLDPGWFGHPGSTTIYIMALVQGLYVLFGFWSGQYESLDAVKRIMAYDPSMFYYLGRLVIVVFASATLVLFYGLARRLTGRWTSVLALALLAVFPIHVSISRLIRSDIQATFFILLSFWFCLSIIDGNRLKDYLWAGFFLGLAVVTKYPAAVFTLTIIAAHFWSQSEHTGKLTGNFRRLLAAGAASAVGVAVGSPFLLLRFAKVLHDVGFEARSYHLSATSHGFFSSIYWYLSHPLAAGLGWLGLILAGYATLVTLRSGNRRHLLVVISAAAMLVFLSAMNLRWARWMVPLTPFMSLLAAMGFSQVWTRVSTLSRSKWVAVPMVGLVLVWVSIPAYGSYLRARALARTDTRTLAWEWINHHVPPGRSILQERYTAQLSPDRYELYWVAAGQLARQEKKLRFVIPQGILGTLKDVASIREQGVDYVMLATDYDRRLWERDRYLKELAVYEYMMRHFRLVYEAWPEDGRVASGPVRIYKVTTGRGY